MASEAGDKPTRSVQDDIQKKGLEFLIGYDVPRVWATGAQIFASPDVTTIVFREQSLVDNDGEQKGLIRNVSSVVLPTAVVREISDILVNQLKVIDGEEV